MNRVAQCLTLGAVLAGLNAVHAARFDSLGLVDSTVVTTSGTEYVHPSVSGDGRVVGASSAGVGFTWTSFAGRTNLAANRSCYPTALSYDGTTVVGKALAGDGYWYPTKWTQGTRSTLSIYPDAYATPTDVSADGSVVVGYQGRYGAGFKWTEHAAWNITGLSKVVGVSGDGMLLAGNKYAGTSGWDDWAPRVPSGPTSRAFTWQNWNQPDLGSLNGPTGSAWAWGISADGRVVVGGAGGGTSPFVREAFRWTAEEGMVGLGAAPGWTSPNDATWMNAANGDGSVLVGTACSTGTAPNQQQAIIWDAAHGIRFLRDVLVNDYGIDLTGWQLGDANGISDDGLTIVGLGQGPLGQSEGWVVQLPEPASILLLLPGACLAARRRSLRP